MKKFYFVFISCSLFTSCLSEDDSMELKENLKKSKNVNVNNNILLNKEKLILDSINTLDENDCEKIFGCTKLNSNDSITIK